MIEPAMFMQRAIGKEPQGRADPLTRVFPFYPAMFSRNAKCCETKTGGGNTGDGAMVLIGG